MDHARRFHFHGHALGVAARIRRPEDRSLPVQACSSLPVTGGEHQSEVGPTELGKWVSFQSAATSMRGDYTDRGAAVAMTRGEVAFDAVPVETVVKSSVRGLSILGRLFVGVAEMGLTSRSSQSPGQPSIQVDGARLAEVRVDSSRLKITLAEQLFRDHDTKEKLSTAFAKDLHKRCAHMFLRPGSQPAAAGRLPEAGGVAKCTLVEEMAWAGEPHPTATIDGHALIIPDFGKVYFGEMVITECSRRLTMVRCQLGSEDGGEVSAAEGEANGHTWPPG
jgi:hypothetical protein